MIARRGSSDSARHPQRSGSPITNMTLATLLACLGERFLASVLGCLAQLANIIKWSIVAREHADRERHQRRLPGVALVVVDDDIAVAAVLVVVMQPDLGVEALA